MKTEIKLSEAIGKTLEAVVISSPPYCAKQAVLCFSGDVFAVLGIARGYEQDDEEITIDDGLDLLGFGDANIVSVGIASQDELDAMRQKRSDEMAARRHAIELRQYEALKAKFGHG